MKCPKCGKPAECDEVDNGVGKQPFGPYGCRPCGWVEEQHSMSSPFAFSKSERRIDAPKTKTAPNGDQKGDQTL